VVAVALDLNELQSPVYLKTESPQVFFRIASCDRRNRRLSACLVAYRIRIENGSIIDVQDMIDPEGDEFRDEILNGFIDWAGQQVRLSGRASDDEAARMETLFSIHLTPR